jgi:hypothetical protein
MAQTDYVAPPWRTRSEQVAAEAIQQGMEEAEQRGYVPRPARTVDEIRASCGAPPAHEVEERARVEAWKRAHPMRFDPVRSVGRDEIPDPTAPLAGALLASEVTLVFRTGVLIGLLCGLSAGMPLAFFAFRVLA